MIIAIIGVIILIGLLLLMIMKEDLKRSKSERSSIRKEFKIDGTLSSF